MPSQLGEMFVAVYLAFDLNQPISMINY